jgi:peptidoglycan/xylan/chitin deacetylase (PgdA/CDA1 family)
MKRRTVIVAGSLALVLLITWLWVARDRPRATADRLLLLVPDGTSFSDPKVTVWIDAGSEEGLHVVPVHDSEFLRPLLGELQCAGVILPDSIHQQASDLFIATLRRFVAEGGKLMLVYDAGTFSLHDSYAARRSRLSDLAGVDYALYDTLGDKTIQWSSVKGTSAIVGEMEIPPGKYYPFPSETSASDSARDAKASNPASIEVELRRYKYGELLYPSFVTSGQYSGKILFQSKVGIVAGEHAYESGSVFFVNLPLGYLKANTDGLPMHAFLKYFAKQILSLPYLEPVPDGIGGLVLNWHVDSNAAIKPLQQMNTWSLLKQGPYSIHITAGPDAMAIGDGRGFDVEHNLISQGLIRKYEGRGYEVGSHGGWIHNYFASHVEKDDPKTLEQFLALNKNALEHATGKAVTEYSAPDGNQPAWVTYWLESHGFVAYYFTGDTGMGPTQGYRGGTREGESIWAFPILHLDRAAGFEEMTSEGYSDSEVARWLDAITEFATDHQSVRLIYFHPPGILAYQRVVEKWLQQTAHLRDNGTFRWYTMTELANFLNSRKQVEWKVSRHGKVMSIDASHPQSLEHETWHLPSDKFAEPKIIQGSAKVVGDKDAWVIVAGQGKTLQFETQEIHQTKVLTK